MVDHFMAYAKAHFHFVIMAAGVLIVVGCIFNWQWAARIVSPSKLPLLRAFIEGLHGTEARYKFERAVSFVCGVILITIGLLYRHLYG